MIRLACGMVLTVGVSAVAIAAAPSTLPPHPLLSPRLLQAPTPAAAGGTPAFDVISIKKNPEPGGNGPLSPPVGGRLRLVNQSVRGLISSSYRMQDYQIIGGPAWLRTDGFDIDAIAEATHAPSLPEGGL